MRMVRRSKKQQIVSFFFFFSRVNKSYVPSAKSLGLGLKQDLIEV